MDKNERFREARVRQGRFIFFPTSPPPQPQRTLGEAKMNKKIRVKLSVELIKEIRRTVKSKQTFDQRVTHLILQGINAEGMKECQ